MRRDEFFIFLTVAAAVAYAPILLFWQRGLEAVFQFFAADAFYYLAVAQRSAPASFFTFDGARPTNGFHPLWQYTLTALFRWAGLGDQRAQLLAVFGLGAAAVAVGSGLFGAALLRLTRNPPFALLGAVPGFYYLLFAPVEPNYGAPWGFANGMETPLSVLLIGILVYLLLARDLLGRPSLRRVAVLSTLLTLITLARLDDVFLFAPFLALAVWRAGGGRSRLKTALLAGGIPAVVIGSYLAYNLAYAGSALPVSGLAKGGLAVFGNLILFGDAFLPYTQFGNFWIGTWSAGAWRSLQLLIPMVAAAAWLGHAARRPPGLADDHRAILAGLCGYALLKGAYNLVNVGLGFQGHWYFAGSLMVTNLILAERIAPSLRLAGRPRLARAATVLAALYIVLSANAFVNAKRLSNYNANFYEFWSRRAEIAAQLAAAAPGSGLVEYDDGIIAYSLQLPAMSGLGFALDAEAHRASRAGSLLPLAYSRGFHTLASLNYLAVPPQADTDSSQIRRALAAPYFFSGEQLDQWTFRVVYRDEPSGAVFVDFQPAR